MEYSQDMDNNMNQQAEVNLDPAELAILEEKIDNLVEYCTKLREENRQLTDSLAERTAEVENLTARLSEYDAMRNDVRLRISKLVRTIEELQTESDEAAEGGQGAGGEEYGSEGSVSQPDLLPSDS